MCSALARIFVPTNLRTPLILSGSAWFFMLNKSQRGICSHRLNLLLQKMPKQNFHECEGHSLPQG